MYDFETYATFREEFNGTKLDSSKWLIVAKQWGCFWLNKIDY